MVFFDSRVPSVGLHSIQSPDSNLQLLGLLHVIVRCVMHVLLRHPTACRRKSDGMRERDKGELVMSTGERVRMPERASASSPGVISDLVGCYSINVSLSPPSPSHLIY